MHQVADDKTDEQQSNLAREALPRELARIGAGEVPASCREQQAGNNESRAQHRRAQPLLVIASEQSDKRKQRGYRQDKTDGS